MDTWYIVFLKETTPTIKEMWLYRARVITQSIFALICFDSLWGQANPNHGNQLLSQHPVTLGKGSYLYQTAMLLGTNTQYNSHRQLQIMIFKLCSTYAGRLRG